MYKSYSINSPDRYELYSILNHIDELLIEFYANSFQDKDYQSLLSRTSFGLILVEPSELVNEALKKEIMCLESIQMASKY
jgi:hypothetical protein